MSFDKKIFRRKIAAAIPVRIRVDIDVTSASVSGRIVMPRGSVSFAGVTAAWDHENECSTVKDPNCEDSNAADPNVENPAATDPAVAIGESPVKHCRAHASYCGWYAPQGNARHMRWAYRRSDET